MANANVVLGNDGVNDLSGSAGRDLIYGFDPNGAQGNVGSITAARVATGLTSALYVTAAPGDSGRLFVVQQTGTVRIVDLVTGQLLPVPFLTASVDANGERGLLGLAFDPDYATNGFVYAYMTVTTGGVHNEIVRYHVNPANPNTVDSVTTVMSLGNLSGATNHNGGWIGFGPDGYLYAAVGDNANRTNAQIASNLFGKIVRIDVHGDAFPADPTRNYAIPSDNMFVGTMGAAPEIFALGLRNPFRDSFDRGTGEFYIADVGESSWEEIDIGRGGANYGWSLYEGPAGSGNVGAGTLTAPIYSYSHSTGIAVIGGYAYRGTSEGLQGQYFFADLGSGHVYTLRNTGDAWVATDRTAQIHTNVGTIVTPTSFGEDARGNLYVVTLGGDVFRLTPDVVSADQGDRMRGLGGDDMMFGGSGNDLLDGGTGKDTMTGGAGGDRFVFAPGYGADIINDFAAGSGSGDRIGLAGFDVHSLSAVLAHATQAGADTVIDLGGGDKLTLLGVTRSNLAADDFAFDSIGQSDFGGNARDDILWFRDNGAVSVWDDAQLGAAHIVGSGIAAGWHIAAKADFDGDGVSDALWQNDNGAVSIWDGAQIGGAHIIASAGVVAGSWHVAGTGDFDGNHHDDILWRNDSGAVSIWDDGQIGGAHVIASAAAIPAGWHIAGTGDFNGDDRSDILWRNDNGAVSIWDSGQVAGAHIVASAGLVPNAWQIAGTGDFDGNGVSDILWRNDNGAVSIWDNGQIGGAHIVAAAGVVPNQSHIADTGDYDGNGRSDVLWRNDNGEVSVWDNGQIGGARIIAAAGAVSNDWEIV